MKKSKNKAKSRAVKKPPVRSAAPKRKTPAAKSDRYQFQLYVTGTTIRSTQAVASIRALCEQHLPGRYQLEVIDMYQQPEQAALGQIIAAPTLIKTFPAPLMRMVGNLANREQVLVKLNLANEQPSAIAL